jgi:splicing factor 3B subunit 3
LEINYGDEDVASSAVNTGNYDKILVIYEVDLGLNHVIRKFAEPVPRTAHHLIAVPGGAGDEGPGGLLVACEG